MSLRRPALRLEPTAGLALFALVCGGVFGLGQQVLARLTGVLSWDSIAAGWWAAELGATAWIAGTSVVFGALATRVLGVRWMTVTAAPDAPGLTFALRAMLRRIDPAMTARAAVTASRAGMSVERPAELGRFRLPLADLLIVTSAGLGGLVAAPFGAAAAAWATIFGGAGQSWEVGIQVVAGILLGIAAGLPALRWRSVAFGLGANIAAVWALALAASGLVPDSPPLLGHPAFGRWVDSTDAVFSVRIGAVLVSALIGLIVGWYTRRSRATLRVLAGAGGPLLVLLAYLVALPVARGEWLVSPLPGASLAAAAAALLAWAAPVLLGWLPRLSRTSSSLSDSGEHASSAAPTPASQP